jgi:molybdopterin synthase sulfur carrier subunit
MTVSGLDLSACARRDLALVHFASMATLRLFASVRVAAGTGRATVDGSTVGEVLSAACARFGPEFAALVQTCRIWRNGEPALEEDPVTDRDEVAILPPVSGG